MIMKYAIEYIHTDHNSKWVIAFDNLEETISWIRGTTATITNMAVGDGYSVARSMRLWKVRDAEMRAIQEPDIPTNIRPE